MTDIELRSLAPEYNEDHHQTYVSRLNAAVSDPRNKNIALTGRYGAGKSSILDEFINDQEKPAVSPTYKWQRIWQKLRQTSNRPTKVLRISINTLGPDRGEDLTNRIQKELVKQLVYRARPGEVRSSEFARTPRLRWWRAGLDALGVAVALVGLLWLFGLRPVKNSLGSDDFWLPMAALFLLVLGILWAIRWYIGNRVVAQVSAGGASIALEGKSDSFFDKYLDELIAFFEATEPDVVVFEDLDRFDDPRIFDSLRELNTLVNSSAHWRDRPDRPLRFVYAIKDSLFEKLGDEQQEKDEPANQANDDSTLDTSESAAEKNKDTAAEATERANRTKFFEIVIPVVPFLSHGNARDHFVTELGKLGLPDNVQIDRGLIDIVARHTTDMRLMLNIGNEFVVYAERLLWVEGTSRKRAPGLTADLLFALVVYKNFHLADFEALPHRGSALDTLNQARRKVVAENIKRLEGERAELVQGTRRHRKQEERARRLGTLLEAWLSSTPFTLQSATINGAPLDVAGIMLPAFWEPIAGATEVAMVLSYGSRTFGLDFSSGRLELLFPEAMDASEWSDSPSQGEMTSLADIDQQIGTLRGADFKTLLGDDRYTSYDRSFTVLAKDTLPSQLAFDLIQQGYIDRFYAEYSTVFYGAFLGVEVANFFRNSVWPNEMDMQFKLTSEDAQNVLEQAPADFLVTRSTLNIDIVNHLMTIDASSSSQLIDFLARPNNADGHQFLSTYLNTPASNGEDLVSQLAARPWSGLFSFIASEGTIDDDDTHVSLLNAALRSAPSCAAFEFDDDVRALIARLHTQIPAFRETQRGVSVETLFAFLTAALPAVPNLRALSPELQKLVVDAKRYALDASNLRAAAALPDEMPLSADTLMAKPVVWDYCTENIKVYLSLVESDEHTTGSCESPEVLTRVVNAQHEDWSAEEMEAFLDATAESATLLDVRVLAEQTVWRTVVSASRAIPNVTNLEAYATEIGVDDALAALLTDDDAAARDIVGVADATEEQLAPLVPLLLNSHTALEPRQRVQLAKQLLNSPDSPGLDLSQIVARADDLLAELLNENVISDSEEVFAHFSSAGWRSIGPALRVSTKAATFITPALIQGHAAEIVRGSTFPETLRRALIERLVEFAPAEDQTFLIAAASAARTLRVALPTNALVLIAPAVRNHEDIVWQLKAQADSIAPGLVVQILGSMSGDFVGFASAARQKFDVGDTPSLGTVLDRLKDAGEIVPQPGRQPRGRWKLRIA